MTTTNLKYVDSKVVFKEIPDEITLAINISGCPIHCPDCHSKYLWEDVGKPLTELELGWLICMNDGISCVAFMGGDAHPEDIVKLAAVVKKDYPSIKVAWYSGQDNIDCLKGRDLDYFDYIKLGPFIKERGPLDDSNTNQRMLAKGYILKKMGTYPNQWYDITDRFWRKDECKSNK